jgi:hypothetical protein
MSAKFKGQGQWVREILRKFGALQEFQPEPLRRDPTCPEWVLNLFMVFFSISHPGVKMKNLKKWKAKDLGRFLGRQYAGEYLVQGGVPVSSQVKRESRKFEAWAEKWITERLPGMNMDEFAKQYEKEARVWRLKLIGFVQEVLTSACERPYLEASAFFEAFGKAVVMKPDALLTERTAGVGEKICWVMFVMWRDIERLRSVGELHRVLEQALKPRGIKVKYKRIEKLCQRIKLKFKDPGRPPGSKTQTNPETI